MPSAPLTLSSAQRIKKGQDFRLTREKGQRLAQGTLILNWADAPNYPKHRLGVITSRRVGKAHVRNRARRLIRESFRKYQHDIIRPSDLIFVARPSIADKGLATVERDFLRALRRARLLKTTP